MPTHDERGREARVAALWVGVPSISWLLSVEQLSSDPLFVGGFAAVIGVVTAVLIWRRVSAARVLFTAWALLVVAASIIPVPQLPEEPLWSAIITSLFAILLAVLGRQVWRVTTADGNKLTDQTDAAIPGTRHNA